MTFSIFGSIFDWFKSNFIGPSFRMLKVRAAIYYLEGIRGAHRILILVSFLTFVIVLIAAGMVMVPLSLILFSTWEPNTKLIIGLVVGAIYIIVPGIVLAFLLSERRWMRITGATDLLRKIFD